MKKISRRSFLMAAGAAAAAAALSGCGNSTAAASSAAASGAASVASSAPAEPVTVKIWHDGDETITGVMQDYVNGALASDKITVAFEKKSGLSDQLKLYGSDAANGPDMYFYAHDSLGMFVAMDILAPLSDVADESVLSEMLPMTTQAGQIGGEQYLLPIYFETLILIYNKALWTDPIPNTTDELYEYMKAHTDTAAGTYALVNQHSTAYNVAPFINGFGGCIVDADGKPCLNSEETKQAVEYNKKFAALEADGDYNTITTLFNEGKAAAIVGGPWLISGIRDAGIDFGVKSLSEITLPNGKPLAPYSGVQSVGVMQTAAASKKDAAAKVLAALASADMGIELAKKSGCAPANSKSYDDAEVAANEVIAAIEKTASTAEPMPNIPEMTVLWGPTENMLVAVNKTGTDVAAAADAAQKEAEQAIADMQ
jgi:arabinogalactan oligomer/maltooligosaccharide transport system substrate-binding protein